jgi:hypothetical protein
LGNPYEQKWTSLPPRWQHSSLESLEEQSQLEDWEAGADCVAVAAGVEKLSSEDVAEAGRSERVWPAPCNDWISDYGTLLFGILSRELTRLPQQLVSGPTQ